MDRRSRQVTHTTRSRRPRVSSLADLITHSEDTMASSQATVVTAHSQRSNFTQSLEGWNQLQNYEDIIGEEIETLRITPEEERRIQKILELARKGKINPANAFEVPIKVANSDLAEGQNMRFWKFASELLSASMGIYDKRVQHVYLGTNRMFESLVRVGNNSTVEGEEPEERNKRQRGAILKMDVSDLGSDENISTYDFGKVNCEEPQKVNVKKSFQQFSADPMFNKRLQAFDSDSLKSLFLNVFETGKNLQINFFNDSHSSRSPYQSQQQRIVHHPLLDQDDEQQSTKTVPPPLFSSQIPSFISEDLKKLNFMAHNNQAFEGISRFKKQIEREGLFQSRHLVDSFDIDLNLQRNQEHNGHNEGFQEHPQENPFFEDSKQFEESTFSMIPNQFSQYSQNIPLRLENDSHSSEYAVSQRFSPALFMSATRQSTGGDIMPWELEFRGMKLQKKKQTKKISKKPAKKQKKKDEEQNILDFLDNVRPKRQSVLKIIDFDPVVPNMKYSEKNILPMNVDPFTRLFAHISSRSATPQIKNNELSFLPQETQNQSGQIQFQHHQPNNFNQKAEEAVDEIPFVSATSQNFWGGSQPQRIAIPSNNVLKNIREIKERILSRIQELGQVNLSEIDIGLSPSSIMVVLLHLANEYKVDITETKEGDMLIRAIY